MIKRVFLLVIIVVIASCSSNSDGYTVNGELRGELKDSTRVFLKTTDSLARTLIDVDTTLIENGSFTFTGLADDLKVHYIMIEGFSGNAPLILENGKISFKAQKDSLTFHKIKGTTQNDLFMNYLEEIRTISSMSKSMNAEFKGARGDTVLMNSLREEFMELQDRAKTFDLDFIKENPNALISVLILEKAVSTKTLPANELAPLYDGLSEEIKGTPAGIRVGEKINKAKGTEIGSVAPNFSGPTPNGETLALNDVKGKITLIDFWAAWCKPCRAENPNIVSVYEKYKDKGLNVLGVSLDRKENDWLNAIETDGLAWNHISNLQYFQGPIAQLYNVNAIPAAFLLDENGVIIAKNLRGPALEQKVAELLN
ncbi:TlpA disulfide reductase family protein [Croceitalea sp. P059]|uniref:TlpA disulfide reductase family protein n=1 Tax=Croceitalea sp. P059 TaxID=3075601 RepID=UPI002885DEDD|nr:TlpA disulfide reductase family protein [Croceitalea sp. P059]MDT0539808.1 TlpA disulfide reductase family protein [Croceitalea sp. P059]